MSFMKNPNKRMRLDLPNKHDGNFGNDDLWGQEDITAEEFDMMEFQATQETSSINTFIQPLPKKVSTENSHQTSLAKQQQYELEGKVKLLSDSLEMLKKDLIEEKLKKENLVAEKILEHQQKEKELVKKVEVAQSSLQFKDQEIKAVYAKMKILEAQLKESKVKDKVSPHKSPNKFLEKFNFTATTSGHSSKCLERQLISSERSNHKLAVDTTREGDTRGCDILSSMLCNKLSFTFESAAPSIQNESDICNPSLQLSAVSVTRISLEKKSEDIFHHSLCVLRNYLSGLHSSANKVASNSNSPLSSSKKRDLMYDKETVVSCLKDLCYIISCPQFFNDVSNFSTEKKNLIENKKIFSQMKNSQNVPSTIICDKKSETADKNIHSLLKMLFKLSFPNTYPNGYVKDEEIEWSLTALLLWCQSDFKSFWNLFDDQIMHSHINDCHSVKATYIVLKIILHLSSYEEYLSKLFHKEGSCHICAVAMLLHRKISVTPMLCINLMSLVLDFISTIFTSHTFFDLKLDSTPCFVMILQAILSSLWKFFKLKNSSCILILKKGFTLLSYVSKFAPNFKERRGDSENEYISLVSGMLKLSKEDPLFKDFYELAHELWDFQEDTSEFDIEDTLEDSMQTTPDLINQNET